MPTLAHIRAAKRDQRALREEKVLGRAADWREYERRKAEWIAQNPGSTTQQYDCAMQALLAELDL